MGASLSPLIANTWLGMLERDLFREIPPTIGAGGRYLDDLFYPTTSENRAITFAEEYAKIHPGIKLDNVTLHVTTSPKDENLHSHLY